MSQDAFDLVVLGAGTAGACAAYHAARLGLRTCVVEAKPRAEAGARWVNAVPAWSFDDAGVAYPEGEERHAFDARFHLNVGYGDAAVTITGHGLFETDMRLLGARLVRLAEEAGAEMRDEVRVLAVDGETVSTDRGLIRGRFVVDASGLAGVRLFGPRTGIELCAAAQEMRRVTDHGAALAYFARHGAREGEVLCFTAVQGGFSVVNVRLEGEALSVLTGSLAGHGYPSGKKMLDDFAAQHAFVGERIFGGARAIPIGRPRDVLVRGRHAVLGDAAGQVFPAHGSGIGVGLVAARWLAESLAEHGSLDPYAVRFQRSLGGLCAGYEAMRRFTARSTREELGFLMEEGLLSADLLRPGLAERMPEKDPRLVPAFARLARKRPGLAARLLHAVGRLFALETFYKTYPRDATRRAAWAEGARVIAERPVMRLVPWALA